MTGTSAGPLTVNDARKAYALILVKLRSERERVLRTPMEDTERAAAIRQVDRALVALVTLGDLIGRAMDAGLLGDDPAAVPAGQAPLLDVGEGARYP